MKWRQMWLCEKCGKCVPITDMPECLLHATNESLIERFVTVRANEVSMARF